MAGVATTNYTSIGYSLEVTPGEINPTPQFTILPTTGGSPVTNITTAVSEVIRSDRQTTDLTKTDIEVSGDLSYELDYPNYKPLMISLLQTEDAGTGYSIPANTLNTANSTLSSVGIEGLVEVGDVFYMSSATNPDNDMPRVVSDTSVPDQITFAPPVPAGTTDGSTDVLVVVTEKYTNGANCDIDSYTFRKNVSACGAATYSYYYIGCMINMMSFNIASASILNGSLGITGLTERVESAPLPGEQADIDSLPYTIMNSISSVAAIEIEGINLGTCKFSSMDLSIDNQINLAKSIGVEGACASAAFSLQITASVEAYFANIDLYNAFLNSTGFSVTIMLIDGDGNVIGINLPYCKFESLDTPISGKDQFLMQSGSLRALMDPTLGYMVKFSFTDAA